MTTTIDKGFVEVRFTRNEAEGLLLLRDLIDARFFVNRWGQYQIKALTKIKVALHEVKTT